MLPWRPHWCITIKRIDPLVLRHFWTAVDIVVLLLWTFWWLSAYYRYQLCARQIHVFTWHSNCFGCLIDFKYIWPPLPRDFISFIIFSLIFPSAFSSLCYNVVFIHFSPFIAFYGIACNSLLIYCIDKNIDSFILNSQLTTLGLTLWK